MKNVQALVLAVLIAVTSWIFAGGGAGPGSVGSGDLRKDYFLVVEFDQAGIRQ